VRCVADAMPCDGAECTFIVLDPSQPDTPGTGELGGAMVGDVNLFLLEPGDAEVEVMIAESSARGKGIGRQAYVSLKSMCVDSILIVQLRLWVWSVSNNNNNNHSVQLMMSYGATRLAIHKFVVKIGDSNEPSLALFHSLGFVVRCSRECRCHCARDTHTRSRTPPGGEPLSSVPRGDARAAGVRASRRRW